MTVIYATISIALTLVGRETLFHTGLTKNIYKGFINSYKISKSQDQSNAFVYVDTNAKSLHFLSDLVEGSDQSSDVLALSVASNGELELMVTE